MVHHYSMIAIGDSGRGFCLSLRSLFPCAVAPHPLASFSHKGRRKSLGVWMPETEDGPQRLAKTSTPVRFPASFFHKGRRGSLGVQMPETGDGTQGLPKKPIPVLSPTPFSHKFRGGQNV
jgi:hypothetical protein